MKRPCDVCGTEYEAKRLNSRFCGDTCRKRFQRNPAPVVVELRPRTPVESGVLTATLAELDAADRTSTSLGQAALALAARIDARHDIGSALAALVKQHSVTLAEATNGAQVAATALDELRVRRDAKRGPPVKHR